ncbi:hypothetical protein ACSBM8_12280 [Sphingomonas sp. ASY06-1R]|uniref:hypothetical protein n=1 Tax=Sphingomonas sp. ASY06-1R TaxID=3445771 RepID=UPI003FA1C4E9
MRQLLSFLGAVMLVLTACTGTAFAAGVPGCSEPARAEMSMHVAGDCDEVPADAHKAYPHHHDGCAGQHFGVTAPETIVLRPVAIRQSYAASRAQELSAYRIYATLRPPQA